MDNQRQDVSNHLTKLIDLFNRKNSELKVTPAFHECEYAERSIPVFYKNYPRHTVDVYIKIEFEPKSINPMLDKLESAYLENYYKSTFKYLSKTDRMHFYIQLAERLDAIHAAGFVHNNFKPDNIFVDKSGVPLIIDFGRVHPQGNVGIRQGTYFFADRVKLNSLILRTPESFSPAADIHAFIMTIYMLENFKSESFKKLMDKHNQMHKKVSDIDLKIRTLWVGKIGFSIWNSKELEEKKIELINEKKLVLDEFYDSMKETVLNKEWLKEKGLDKFKFQADFLDEPESVPCVQQTMTCEEFKAW